MTPDEVEVGMILYIISKSGDPSPLPSLDEKKAEIGWSYFRSVCGRSDEISKDTFDAHILMILKRTMHEFGVKEKVCTLLSFFASNQPKSNEEMAEKIIERLIETAPILSSTIFCLFGENFRHLGHNYAFMLMRLDRSGF